jgi:hypothetical protein
MVLPIKINNNILIKITLFYFNNNYCINNNNYNKLKKMKNKSWATQLISLKIKIKINTTSQLQPKDITKNQIQWYFPPKIIMVIIIIVIIKMFINLHLINRQQVLQIKQMAI